MTNNDLIAENKRLKEQIKELKLLLTIEKVKNNHLEAVNASIANQVKVTEDKKEVAKKITQEYLADHKQKK